MSKKILVADDSQTIQRAVAIALEDEDIELIGVTDPTQVLARAQETSPDLILLDNRMNRNGVDDGYEIATQLKNTVSQIPLVFLAGHSYQAEKGDAVGAVLSIVKPFESKDLCEKINSLLRMGASLSGEAVAVPQQLPPTVPSPQASILQSPPPRETTAAPAFRPTNPSSLLPEGDSRSNLTPPPLPGTVPPSSLLPANERSLANKEPSRESLTPPPLPGTPPPMPSSGSSGHLTPPPMPEAMLDDAPQTVEYATPPPQMSAPAAAEPTRRSPLIIPPPSDEPKEFPVKELLQRPAASNPTPESELEMASPEYIQQVTEKPDFALDPNSDYLARALNRSRKFRQTAAAPSSPQDAAQMEYIRQLSTEVIERIAWEVVPELAEQMIKEALARQNQS